MEKENEKTFKLAILTPAYNRNELLEICFKSLQNQTCKDFVWYVVDDGSKIPQEAEFNKLKPQADFEMVLIRKENGGKHTAINTGVQAIKEPAVLILDNDDFLTPDAVERVKTDWLQIKDDESLCGIGYLKETKDGKIVGKPYTKDGHVDTFINQRFNCDTWGDKTEVFKTEILKKFPFPEFSGEKFIGEASVWCAISGNYKFKFFNKSIYICEYLDGGLSDNLRKTIFANPQGATYCYKVLSGKGFNLKNKIKYTLLYIAHSKACKNKFNTIIKESNNKLLIFLLMPFGLVIYRKRKICFKN